jgi:hypothetical protein
MVSGADLKAREGRAVRFVFGIYPGGLAGTDAGVLTSGLPDVPERITAELEALHGEPGRPFGVWAYHVFGDAGDMSASVPENPLGVERYLGCGRSVDLVAQFQSRRGDVDGFASFVADLVARYGPLLGSLQVGEELNVAGNPMLDGYYPRVGEALVAGVSAAKTEARRLGHEHIAVGINTTPLFGTSSGLLKDLVTAGGPRFTADLDYIGLDFFPDVFRPIAPDRLRPVVERLLRQHRRERLEPAGFGQVSLRITECGWSTGQGRSPQRQVEVLKTVVGAVTDNAATLL